MIAYSDSANKLIDGHVHTEYCRHAEGSMAEYVEEGIRKGLGGIIFLEHLELGITYPHRTWLTGDDFIAFCRDVEGLRTAYRGRIRIGTGVEVGWNPERAGELRDFIRNRRWDRVGLSYHFINIGGEHFNLVSRRRFNLDAFAALGTGEVIDRYLDGIMEGITRIPADTVCHIDAPLRYLAGVDMMKSHHHRLEEVLVLIRDRGVALEVNCSGFPLRGEPFPGFDLLEKAREMGIDFTLGSDAHHPGDVGRHFNDLPEWIRLNSSSEQTV